LSYVKGQGLLACHLSPSALSAALRRRYRPTAKVHNGKATVAGKRGIALAIGQGFDKLSVIPHAC
jgi:hypothetical protein